MLDYCHSNPVSAKDLPPKQCFVGAAYQFLKLMLCYFQAQFECQRAFYCHTALICIHRTVGTLNIFVIYIIKKCEASTNIAKGDCFDTFALSVKVISKAEIIIAHSSVVATLVSISSSRTAQPFTFSVWKYAENAYVPNGFALASYRWQAFECLIVFRRLCLLLSNTKLCNLQFTTLVSKLELFFLSY